MSPLRPIHVLFLILSLLVITVLSSTSDKSLSSQDNDQFQALLADLAESDMHEVLHDWSHRFKDGVFHRDRTAMEAVHSENAAVATELIKLAKSKRATSNTTTSVTESTSSRSAPPPPPPTTMPSTTSTNIRTTVVPPTSPTGLSIVSSTSDAVIFSSTNGGITTAHSSTAVVAISPSSTTLLLTTTLPGGAHSIITSTAVVNAAYTTLSTDTAVAAQSGTATGTPSLQTGGVGGAQEYLHGAIGIAAGAIAIAFAQ